MSDDPWRHMEQQTRKADAARRGLLNTWAHADPPAADLPTRTGPRIRTTAPSDPTTSAITTAEVPHPTGEGLLHCRLTHQASFRGAWGTG